MCLLIQSLCVALRAVAVFFHCCYAVNSTDTVVAEDDDVPHLGAVRGLCDHQIAVLECRVHASAVHRVGVIAEKSADDNCENNDSKCRNKPVANTDESLFIQETAFLQAAGSQ